MCTIEGTVYSIEQLEVPFGEKKMLGNLAFALFAILLSRLLGEVLVHSQTTTTKIVSRDDFPSGFVFGAGTSAYQIEGAASEDGRTPSIWDTFTHAGKMPDKSTGDIAADGYHKYKEDVKLMSETGLDAYRFSISWSRLIPNGRGAVNPKGLKYYSDLIDKLHKHGIEPHVTIYHLDLPQVLEDEYGGWLSPQIIDDFTAFADVCFKQFGDRVRHWTSFAEPNVIGQACYDYGIWPPCRCSKPFGFGCKYGNSTTEPYIAIHNILLSHASVVSLYRTKYRAVQNGKIGINVYGVWYMPFTNATTDTIARERGLEFTIGWILHPLIYGDYPIIMKQNAGSRLPTFAKKESNKIMGSVDFVGINYYTSVYISDSSKNLDAELRDYIADACVALSASKDVPPSGKYIPSQITSRPAGLHNLLDYISLAYGNIPTYVHENGYGVGADDGGQNDTSRIDYLSDHISSTLDAIKNGSNVKGYFVWSFMDVFEFLGGYKTTCGLYHVDFEDKNRRRRPKLSAYWYRDFLRKSGKMMNTIWPESNRPLHTEY